MGDISNRNRKLVNNTIIFTIGNFASKFISFFLVPLYTHVLAVSEFGKVDLIYTVCTILAPVCTLNISESVMRFSLDKDANRDDILRIAKYILLISILPCVIIYFIVGRINILSEYSIYLVLYLLFLMPSQIFLAAIKGQEKLRLYTLGGVLNTFLLVVFNIIFLLVLKMGIKGYLIAYISSSFAVTLYGYIFSGAYKCKIININKKLMKKMLKYSSVLIPTTFMWWIMNSSDRIMVTSMISETANGIYAVSYKLPTLISVIIAIFNQAWLFSALDEKDSDDKEKYTNKVYKTIFCVLNIVGLLLLFGCKTFMKIYVPSDYYIAWRYMSFLIVGVIFQSLSTFISTSYSVNKDNKGFLYSGLIGAIVNIILNSILIPVIGVYGAALATGISYITVFVYRVIDTKKYVSIHVLEKKYIISYFLLLLAAGVLYIDSYVSEIIIFVILVLFCGLYYNDFKSTISIFFKRKGHKDIKR